MPGEKYRLNVVDPDPIIGPAVVDDDRGTQPTGQDNRHAQKSQARWNDLHAPFQDRKPPLNRGCQSSTDWY